MEYIDSIAQKYIPWDSSFVQRWWPSVVTYEASTVSGCSGGELDRLVAQAKSQGLEFRDEKLLAGTHLCQPWTYHASARGVLEAMAQSFQQCFTLDQTHAMGLRLESDHICRTNYALSSSSNEWEPTQGAVTLLCLDRALKTPMASTHPMAHDCPQDVLERLQFTGPKKAAPKRPSSR
jgi:hypothetical protein